MTINSGNRNYYDIDINFLLVFSLPGVWLFITWGKGALCWGSSLVLGGHFRIRDHYLGGGGSLINLMKVVQNSIIIECNRCELVNNTTVDKVCDEV